MSDKEPSETQPRGSGCCCDMDFSDPTKMQEMMGKMSQCRPGPMPMMVICCTATPEAVKEMMSKCSTTGQNSAGKPDDKTT